MRVLSDVVAEQLKPIARDVALHHVQQRPRPSTITTMTTTTTMTITITDHQGN